MIDEDRPSSLSAGLRPPALRLAAGSILVGIIVLAIFYPILQLQSAVRGS